MPPVIAIVFSYKFYLAISYMSSLVRRRQLVKTKRRRKPTGRRSKALGNRRKITRRVTSKKRRRPSSICTSRRKLARRRGQKCTRRTRRRGGSTKSRLSPSTYDVISPGAGDTVPSQINIGAVTSTNKMSVGGLTSTAKAAHNATSSKIEAGHTVISSLLGQAENTEKQTAKARKNIPIDVVEEGAESGGMIVAPALVTGAGRLTVKGVKTLVKGVKSALGPVTKEASADGAESTQLGNQINKVNETERGVNEQISDGEKNQGEIEEGSEETDGFGTEE